MNKEKKMKEPTFTQLYIHIVFTVKEREKVLKSSFREEIFRYITGIVQNKKHKMLEINGVEDHIHILVGMHPAQSLSDLVRDIKFNSARFINDNKFIRGQFSWQEGYGAFSIGRSELKKIHSYIQNQPEHHLHESTMGEKRRFYQYYGYQGVELDSSTDMPPLRGGLDFDL